MLQQHLDERDDIKQATGGINFRATDNQSARHWMKSQ